MKRISSRGTLKWQQLFEDVILEVDPDKLSQKIQLAQDAIMNEIEDALHRGESGTGWQLMDALTTLRDLRAMEDRERNTDSGSASTV
jgi:hypothetical protein